MKQQVIHLFWIFLLAISHLSNAQSFRTETFSDMIRTLQVFPSEYWNNPPIIRLQQGEQIEIKFDLLSAAPEHYTYRVLHCNADWTPSQLLESEYLTGLQNHPLDDYAYSFNTTMDYINYRLLIPNERVDLRVSGNYVVQILSENGTKPIVNACFSVIETQAGIEMQVSPITDRGANTSYQEVNFEVRYGNDIRSPLQDLKVYVFQNNRLDNAASLVRPLSIQNRSAVYAHSPALIFEAGNEYRAFEMTTVRFPGLNIERVEFFSPFYHTTLGEDRIRSDRSYSFNEDINGRVFIRNIDAEDSDIEADYQFVHFYIPCEKPFAEDIYILSDAFNNILDERSQMAYSVADRGYVQSVLLKEGYYNYLYVNKTNSSSPGSAALIEGNFFQTENEYRVMVYARPAGWRYDRLIGVQNLQFK